jgi:RNA polymerase II subunit A-like phosphatase
MFRLLLTGPLSVQTNSGPSTPTRLKRKRLRSVTPSADGVNGSGTRDALGSPLAKRKKVAAERTGYSKLKEAISADDLQSESSSSVAAGKQRSVDDAAADTQALLSSPASRVSDDGMQGEEDDEDEEDGDDDDDDFLARELEEEWG